MKLLNTAEKKGGEKAFSMIKSAIPDYMTCNERPLALVFDPHKIAQREGAATLKQLGYRTKP